MPPSIEMLLATVVAALTASLRLAPLLAFAPPFSLVPVPLTLRILLALTLAGLAATARGLTPPVLEPGPLLAVAAGELLIGIALMLPFQLAFAAIQLAGRTLDIQSGFGLAMLIDPTTRAQTPLVGTLLAMQAGAVFFAAGGHYELLAMAAASMEALPSGGTLLAAGPGRAVAFAGSIMAAGLGAGAAAMIALFLADLAIAALSRTAPQLNALMLGLQIKTLLLLVVLAMTWGATTAVLARMMALAMSAVPRLLGG